MDSVPPAVTTALFWTAAAVVPFSVFWSFVAEAPTTDPFVASAVGVLLKFCTAVTETSRDAFQVPPRLAAALDSMSTMVQAAKPPASPEGLQTRMPPPSPLDFAASVTEVFASSAREPTCCAAALVRLADAPPALSIMALLLPMATIPTVTESTSAVRFR